MRIGALKERHPGENRVAMTPASAGDIRKLGHDCLVESGAGEHAGFSDDAYRAAGVEVVFRANVFAQVFLTQQALPQMLERGSGAVIDVVSAAGLGDPPAPAGKGGWGFAYAASKAAFHRLAGVLAVEHAGRGILFFNVEPGFVMTEAMALNDPDGELRRQFKAAPPSVPFWSWRPPAS